jgi:1,2-diacylglycerol 3-alpha-glucosyltransferase
MKIGMLVDRYKPYISGVTNCVSLNKEYLEKAGHEVYVFTFGDEDYNDEEANVIRSPGLPLIDTGFTFNLWFGKRARRLMSQLDIAHVHHPFLSGSLALRFFPPRGIPILFTNHTRYDLYTHAYLPVLPESVGETAMRAFLPAFCRRIDLVIAPSQGLANVLRDFGVDAQIKVIPNGVNLEPFQNPAEPFERESFGIDPEAVILIYVGRLGPEKNLAFLLRSFVGVAKAQENVHLVLVGDGPEHDNLVDRAKQSGVGNRIHFAGFVPYTHIPNYLSMADAFVTASVTEVHPLTVIEAMARGLPVLGIDSPGVGDSIEDGYSGFLSNEDLATFTAKMMRLADDRELRLSMGKNARQAAQIFDINRTVNLTLEQYHLLTNYKQKWPLGLQSRVKRIFDRWN